MDEVNQALHKIARGTGIVFVGTVLAMLLTFLSRAIIARYFERSQYGIFNLTLTVLSLYNPCCCHPWISELSPKRNHILQRKRAFTS